MNSRQLGGLLEGLGFEVMSIDYIHEKAEYERLKKKFEGEG